MTHGWKSFDSAICAIGMKMAIKEVVNASEMVSPSSCTSGCNTDHSRQAVPVASMRNCVPAKYEKILSASGRTQKQSMAMVSCSPSSELTWMMASVEVGPRGAMSGERPPMTPIVKLYTCKKSVEISGEGMESFGGLGFVEESGIPELLRDSYVNVIWEGTTNVLSMDTLRVFQKTPAAVEAFERHVTAHLAKARGVGALSATIAQVSTAMEEGAFDGLGSP